MTFTEIFSNEAAANAVLGGLVGTVIILGIAVAVIVLAAFYVYFALAWRTIARKLKYEKDWLAWIPFANISMILQMGGFHWAWTFLVLIPVLGWFALVVLMIIATWRIFELRGYPGWFSLSQIIPKVGGILYLVAIGFVAWQDKGHDENKITQIKKSPAKKKARKKKK